MEAEQAAVDEGVQELIWRPRADYGSGLGSFRVDVEMMAGEFFGRVFCASGGE
jgi:hypothetical protein